MKLHPYAPSVARRNFWRDLDIYLAWLGGETKAALARRYGVCAHRVREVVDRAERDRARYQWYDKLIQEKSL